MKKSELREMIRECLREELAKANLKESVEEPVEKLAVVFLGNDRNKKAVLSKITEPRHMIVFSVRDFIRQYDNMKYDGLEKGSVKFYTDAEGIQELKDTLAEVPARISEPILKVTTLLEGALTESTLTAEEKVVATPTIPWEELLVEADSLLEDLCVKSGNADWDDGDGYWQEEHTTWCNRKLYYIRLNDTTLLEKLCAEYSKKLPNVEFYFYDDEDEEVSEIGYTATRDAGSLSEAVISEAGDNRFYVTYEDAYYEGIDLCFVSRDKAKSEAHWETDIEDFNDAGQSEEFALLRAVIEVDKADVAVFDRISDKEWSADQRTDWEAARDLLETYIDADLVKVIDEEGTIK
jgi:hypothetical protein